MGVFWEKKKKKQFQTTFSRGSQKKKKKEIKTSPLRLVMSEVGNERIAKGGELTDEDITQVISKEAKKRQESIAAFVKGERQDLAEKEEKELSILKTYLPAQIAQDELIKIVDLA